MSNPRGTPAGMRKDASQIYRRYLSAMNLNAQAAAAASGLNATDFYALNLLSLNGPMTSGELADQTGLTTGATTRLIDRLERAGHARRSTVPGDRRKVIVEPVISEVPQAVVQSRQLVGDVFKRYSKEELDTLFDYFTRAAEAYLEATKRIRKLP